MKNIKIGNKIIGPGNPCFIIAEAGVNHNGSLELAKKLVDIAVETGADSVKFQTFKSENLVTREADITEYQKKNIGRQESQLEMLKKIELGYDGFIELKKYCDEKGIIFLSCPHSEDAVDFLEDLVPAYKVGSGDLTNIPILEKIAKKGKPVILSTGMGDLEEVEKSVKAIREAGNEDIILFHCVTNYPCSADEINLRAMLTIRDAFYFPVGFSDHSLGITIPIAAVALGANILEKHFTIDKNLPGPDHILSLEPQELKEMVKAVRETEKALGTGIKKPAPSEQQFKKLIRKSIIAARDIPAGSELALDMLVIKRPGTGILPEKINEVIGKKAKRDIKRDTLIKFDDLVL